MRKLLLLAIGAVALNSAQAQDCSDVFISEYVEGWSNNKSIEVYNPTLNSIDLSNYAFARFSNGADISNPTAEPIMGTILPGEALVFTLDKRDTAGTGFEAPVWEDLQAKTDFFIDSVYDGPMYYNGDDAFAIIRWPIVNNTVEIVDQLGKIGEDPGASWTDVFPYNDASGGAYWTKDQTLIRKRTVKAGVTTNPTYFDPTLEYDSMPANFFDSLGVHTCDCPTTSVGMEEETAKAGLFPNPMTEQVTVRANQTIEAVTFFNMIGQPVRTETVNQKQVSFERANLVKGVYLVEIRFVNGTSQIQKLVIK